MSKIIKHITICSTSYHEYDRRLLRIAYALQEGGYQVKWISRSLSKASDNSQIEHRIISTYIKKGPLFYLEYNVRLMLILLFSKSTIINSIDLDTVPACVIAGKLTRKQIVHDAHEIFYEVPELTGKVVKKKIWKLVAKIFLPRIKHNYTVNQSLATHFKKNYELDYGVIRNLPIADTITSTKPKTNNKTLIYLGVLNEGRGLEIAIAAVKKLTDYKLMIVGEGDISSQLRKQAEGMDNVIFCGYTRPDKISDYLNQASIGLNMLVAHSLNYKLSLANKFFDYMHAGLPSINMAYPEYEYILSQHEVGLTVAKYNVPMLCTAIRRMENTEIYNKLSSNCLEFKNSYSWSKEKTALLEIYSKI